MLNFIWVSFFLCAFATASCKLLFWGDTQVFGRLLEALLNQAKSAFEIALGLTGVLSFWLGVMKIGERSGAMQSLTRFLEPFFRRLMPEIPPGHPAMSAMVMNIAANMLGLDNAATPLGIKAMQELQTLNPKPDTASNAQILFLVINTSSVTLFPVTVFTYRAQLGAENPTDVFIPILLATYVSTLAGLLVVSAIQRINLLNRVVMAYLAGVSVLVAVMARYFVSLPNAHMLEQSALLSQIMVLSLIVVFIGAACYKRINAYEAFVDGAKQGFQTAVTIVPYLVAMLTAIAVFRASGTLEWVMDGLGNVAVLAGLDNRFVDALPTAFIKPFSGSGARAMMIDAMSAYGADSFTGRLVCIIQGSTETTFYVLAVYFGAAGIKNSRYAAGCGIIADLAGVVASIFIAYWFFG
ncbi:MAG: hypothetical protein CTY24_11955 [Methylobacter sp.]|nr:MAG: hypothetical protein CTY24_11955 [Methylobacter sp.]